MYGLKIISLEKRFSVTRKKLLRISIFTFQVREKEREGRAENGEKDKARRNEREEKRERNQNTVQPTFFYPPARPVHQLVHVIWR